MSDPLTDPTHAHSRGNSSAAGSNIFSDSAGSQSPDKAGDEDNPLPSFHPPTQPGDLGRLGRYRLRKPLGKGGMGAVYLGYDDVLRRKIAIKVLMPKFAANKVARERFLREARTAASVASPHVVSIIDVDEDLGIPFIAMEYLQGIPLDRYLSTHAKLSLKQVLRIGQEVARGLAAAHAAGLVHRDIKPANLWLEAPHGHVKILDFGLAKETEPQGGADVTQAGQLVGTPAFMSPEQARGDVVDARTDLFCLGIVLYRLCTGKQPFVGPTAMAVLMSIGIDEPPPVRQLNPAVPEALASLIYRLLRKNPADRPQTAADVHADLVALENEKGAAVPDATVVASVSEYIPIAVPPQGDRVWEQFDDPTEIDTATTQADSKRKPVERVPFPWRIVGGVFAVLLATLVFVAILMTPSKRPQDDFADADLVRPNPVVPTPVTPKVDTDRRVAEWVLGLPGTPSVDLVGQALPVTHLTKLPSIPFKIRRIHVAAEYAVTDADLKYFQDLPSLDSIDFKRSLITDAGVEKLSKIAAAPHLVELSLGTEAVTDEGMRPFVAFRALRNVSLAGPNLSHTGIKILQFHCQNLTHLTLDRVKISDWDLAPFCLLRWFMKLEHLGISCPTITPLGLGFLSTWPGLKSVQISGKGVTDAEMHQVLRIPSLQALALHGTSITNAGLEKLEKINGLRRLTITTTPKVTTAGLVKFKAAHPDCYIESDSYQPKLDLERVAAEWVLAKTGAHVSVHGVFAPIANPERLPHGGPLLITEIDLPPTAPLLSDADLGHLDHLPGLVRLRLGRCKVTDAGFKKLSESPAAAKYTSLAITSSEITNAALTYLKPFDSLTVLELAGSKVTDAGVSALLELPTLTWLDLSHTALTDEALLALAGLKNLKTLNLRDTRVTPAGVRKLWIALPGCRFICSFPLGTTVPLDPAWAASVAKMTPAQQVKAVVEELIRRNPKFDGNVTPTIFAGGVVELQFHTDAIHDIAPVGALTKLRRLHCTGDGRGIGLLTDISPLAGLSHLVEMDLEKNRNLVDLSPLKGLHLTVLNLGFTGVNDISLLAEMPLKEVHLNPIPLKDFSPLLKCPDLAEIFIDFGLTGLMSALQVEALRTHPSLKRVEGIPVAVFWPAWDRRKEPTKLPGPQKVIPTSTRDVRVAFDADGKRLATHGFDSRIQVWDVKTGNRLHLFDGRLIDARIFGQAAEFVAGTDLIAAGYNDGLRFWNMKTGKPDGDKLPPFEQFSGLAVSPDGKTVVGQTGSGKFTIARHSVATRLPLPGLEGHTGAASLSAFSHDGKLLMTASSWPDGSVRVWDVDASTELYRQERPWVDPVVSVSFSPDNHLAVYVSTRSVVELIDWKAKKVEKTLRWFPSGGAALAPDGRHVILGGVAGILTILDLATGEVVAEGYGGSRCGRVAVSPDGKTIATGHIDGSVRLWDWDMLMSKKP